MTVLVMQPPKPGLSITAFHVAVLFFFYDSKYGSSVLSVNACLYCLSTTVSLQCPGLIHLPFPVPRWSAVTTLDQTPRARRNAPKPLPS